MSTRPRRRHQSPSPRHLHRRRRPPEVPWGEAKALSTLNHPSIATVHDFDTEDGVDFLVMECVEGKTLREKLDGGALPEEEVRALGVQIAEALEEAHERGVVHRDLKPSNIAVTAKGRVKVLDFGLARLLHPVVTDTATTGVMTEELAVAGTLPYMAPEELRGARSNPRSDLPDELPRIEIVAILRLARTLFDYRAAD
ncbi:MAG: serine/threonine-protein kinase [Vicinamibacteria bacterium]